MLELYVMKVTRTVPVSYTHLEMQFARAVADRIIFLDDGDIKEEGTPDQFFDAPKTDRAKKFLQTFTFERKGSKQN